MKAKYCTVLLISLLFCLTACNGQIKDHQTSEISDAQNNSKIVGGGCDGCELMYVGMPSNISSTDTSAGWHEEGQKLLISGKVFKLDGTTPASDVIIYYWQTDQNGYYTPKEDMDESAKRHGHLRGWIRTDGRGHYSIYTIRPAPYPNQDNPAHIHLSVKEPEIANEYYIDEFVFDDDPLLTDEKRKALDNRGGSGILSTAQTGDILVATHDIVLGLNIPDYPK